MPKFEQVSSSSNPQKRIEGMKHLLTSLPESNRALLAWIFVHMGHVIERERFNKMTLQNVSIVLSPTMRISHRVLNCFFENSHILFDASQFKKYVPPITSSSVNLPETEVDIELEIRKQESLLADLHLQISSGAASKKTEEQIWEQQRIVTQLKRKLRTAVKKESEGDKKFEPIDYEEELDFSLRVPSRNDDAISQASHDAVVVEAKKDEVDHKDHKVTVTIQKNEPVQASIPENNKLPEVPRETHVTVIKVQEEVSKEPSKESAKPQSQVQVQVQSQAQPQVQVQPQVQPQIQTQVQVQPQVQSQVQVQNQVQTQSVKTSETMKAGIPLLPPPPASNKTRVPHQAILKPTPASPPLPQQNAAKNKPVNNVTLQVIDSSSTTKSKSLPRGLPSDESAFNQFQQPPQGIQQQPLKPEESQVVHVNDNDANIEELQMECLRLKLEFDELMAVKSELEQRKRSEYKEMEDLREEIATMQTLYQYRYFDIV